jgi:chemotaxis protein histidine kinase CheA
MDVVKSNIEELGGEVQITSELGKGSTFSYRIPQVTAVNILDCLTVRADKNLFAIPILNVVSTLRIPIKEIHVAFGKGKSITYLGSIITLFDLNELLGDKAIDESSDVVIVIVEAKNGRLALAVTELLTPEKLVYTPLASIFNVQGISGVTMMSGNKMGLIIDPAELVTRSTGMDDDDIVPVSSGTIMDLVTEELEERGVEISSDQPLVAATTAESDDSDQEQAGGFVALSSDIGREISHRDEFLIELDELINAAGQEILSLEANPSDTELLNKIFRDYHSMKGNLMMVGLTELGNFIHDIEAILDQARSGNMEITTEIVDILLDSTDVIKDARQSLADGSAPKIDKSLLNHIAKFQKPKDTKKYEVVDVHQRTFHLSSLETFNLLARRHSGHFVYQLFISFEPQFQQPFLVSLLIMRRISNIGYVFGSVPSIEEIENQNLGNQLKIMFSSQLDQESLTKFVEDVLVKFYDVNDYEILKTF